MMASISSVQQAASHSPAVTRDADREIESLASALRSHIEGEVRFGRHDRMLYATDASMYQVEPLGVVVPKSIDDAVTAAQICFEHGQPILPRGGGTSLAGQAVNRAVVIDFSANCNRLLEMDPGSRTARVEPGIVLDALNRAAAPHRLMFGPDVATAAHACIGGMIGNNSAGAHSILFGRMIDHVRSLDVLLADGTRAHLSRNTGSRDEKIAGMVRRLAEVITPISDQVRATFPTIIRKTGGYPLDVILDQIEASSAGTHDHVNLASLMCGAEGTLALTLEATVGLVDSPACTGLALVAFESLDAALHAVPLILETGPSAVELVDDVVIAAACHNVEYRQYVELLPTMRGEAPRAVLYVEYFARDEDELSQRHAELTTIIGPSRPMHLHTSQEAMNRAWKLRRAGEPLLCALPGERKPLTFIEDTAVDPSNLAAFVSDFRAMVERHGTSAAYYAHASVGCLHIRPMIDLRSPVDREHMAAIMREACDLVVQYGGALSAEHGIGRLRSNYLEQYFGPDIAAVFRSIKHIFDPRGLLNPGVLVEPHPPDVHLRIEPLARTPVLVPTVDTYFHYDHGFSEAVEACNGSGVCRKTRGGTMCPSYRATRDERHATRGRGNALRLAITGQFSDDGRSPRWNDPGTMQTLNLCLSCKACKTECPSNVDIAKLKAEYTGQRYRELRSVPVNARMLGRVRALNAIGSALHPVANVFARSRITRSVANRLLGIDPRRSLPTFGRSLYRWHESRGEKRGESAESPAVILFPDCFTTYSEPHVGRAAIQSLEALGYRVMLPRLGCCGRAMISTGQLDAARRSVDECAVELRRSLDASGALAIVGCEPSCISAIKDDWVDLKCGVDRTALRDLAARTMLIEQFIDSRWASHPRPATLQGERTTRAILHGHCHQKSLWGIDSSAAMLRRIVPDDLTVLDNGCCGMAGAFGLERAHFDVSRRIFELELAPAIRDHAEALIIAPGTSCRHQIRDFAGRDALHPIEVVARSLGGG
jgi:FAD/FMN-containing dehydrogenase/Fe-S oxidoreductase